MNDQYDFQKNCHSICFEVYHKNAPDNLDSKWMGLLATIRGELQRRDELEENLGPSHYSVNENS